MSGADDIEIAFIKILGNDSNNPVYIGYKEDCLRLIDILEEYHKYDRGVTVEMAVLNGGKGSDQKYLQECLDGRQIGT